MNIENQPRDLIYVTERNSVLQTMIGAVCMVALLLVVTITALDKIDNLSSQLTTMQTTCAEAKLVKDK